MIDGTVKERIQKYEESSAEIIKSYVEKTSYLNEDVIRVPDTASSNVHKIWVFKSKGVNPLGIEEDRLHYFIIRKKWFDYNVWSDERKTPYGKWGIIIPLAVYEYIAQRKNYRHELVVSVTNDVHKYKSDLHFHETHSFYSITFEEMNRFIRKYFFVSKTAWGDEVLGLPYSLFKRV
jgi:hypothetical protein